MHALYCNAHLLMQTACAWVTAESKTATTAQHVTILRCRLLNPATINVVVIAVSCIKTTPYGPPYKHAGAVEDCDVTAQLVRVVSCPECSFVLDHHGLSIADFCQNASSQRNWRNILYSSWWSCYFFRTKRYNY